MGGCCGGDRPYYREEAERRDRESRDAEQRDHKEKSEAEYQKQQYENNQRQNSEGGTSQAGDAGLGCFFIIIILLGLSLLKVMAVVETSAANKIAAEDAERVDGLRSRIKATLTGAVDQRADAVPFLPIDDEIEALHSSSLRLEVGKAREECLLQCLQDAIYHCDSQSTDCDRLALEVSKFYLRHLRSEWKWHWGYFPQRNYKQTAQMHSYHCYRDAIDRDVIDDGRYMIAIAMLESQLLLLREDDSSVSIFLESGANIYTTEKRGWGVDMTEKNGIQYFAFQRHLTSRFIELGVAEKFRHADPLWAKKWADRELELDRIQQQLNSNQLVDLDAALQQFNSLKAEISDCLIPQ